MKYVVLILPIMMLFISCGSLSVEHDPADKSRIISYDMKLKTSRGLLGNNWLHIKRHVNANGESNIQLIMKFYGYYLEKFNKDFIELSFDGYLIKCPVSKGESYASVRGVEKLTDEEAAWYSRRRLWHTTIIHLNIQEWIANKFKYSQNIYLRVSYSSEKGEDSSTFEFSNYQKKKVTEMFSL